MRRFCAPRSNARPLWKMIALSNSSCLSETTPYYHDLLCFLPVSNKSSVLVGCPPSRNHVLSCGEELTLKKDSPISSTLSSARVCGSTGFDVRKKDSVNIFNSTPGSSVVKTAHVVKRGNFDGKNYVVKRGNFDGKNYVRWEIVNWNRYFSTWNNFSRASFLDCGRRQIESFVPQVSASNSIDVIFRKALRSSRIADFCKGVRASHTSAERESASLRKTAPRISSAARAAAEEALLDYLNCTRGLYFTDADHMSRNSPELVRKLLSKVGDEEDVKHSLVRFLRYHPINEFESFFESIGLKPEEFYPLLPQGLVFLSDRPLLMENYHVLCNYGVPRSKLGKVYLEAREIFTYDYDVLQSKIRAYEMLGLNSYTLIKLITASPLLLVGDVDVNFNKVLEELKAMEIGYEWIGESISAEYSYEWDKILHTIKRLQEFGFSKKKLSGLLRKRYEIVFDGSGSKTHVLIALFLKSGLGMNEILDIFSQSPEMVVGNFLKNFLNGIHFLNYIWMEPENIAKIIHSHPRLLGSCCFKKPDALMTDLNVGRSRLCSVILEDPNRVKEWVKGKKVRPLPGTGEEEIARQQKIEFLLRLGFPNNSDKLEKAFKRFRGRGDELQERFNCLVNAGINFHDVAKMVKLAPPLLNQSTAVIKDKMDILVNKMNCPLATIVSCPSFLCYDPERIRIRLSMYNWLAERGFARPSLSFSTILACSEDRFTRQFVNNHPEGPEVWKRLSSSASC